MRRRRALVITFFVALLCAGPLYYLWTLHQRNPSSEDVNLGMIPEFAFTYEDGSGGITHFDTFRHITVLAIPGNCANGCSETLRRLAGLMSWAEDHLKEQNHDVPTPEPIKFLLMTATPLRVPAGWQQIVTAPDNFILPKDFAGDRASPQLVIIDDDGYFRLLEDLNTAETMPKAQRLLSKLTSRQFLLHYVVSQTLMWEKYKGRR